MTSNPLRLPRYSKQEFDQWNFAIRRSIWEYDRTPKDYPAELMRMKPLKPKARYSAQSGTKICAEPGCNVPLKHLRSMLCEPHREARYRATKHGRSE